MNRAMAQPISARNGLAPLATALVIAAFCLPAALFANGGWLAHWGEPYLRVLNRGFLALLGAQVVCLALGRGRLGLAGALFTGVAGFALVWLGLAGRGVVSPGLRQAAEFFAPLAAAVAVGAGAVFLVFRLGLKPDLTLAGAAFTLLALGLSLLARFQPELSAVGRAEVLSALTLRQTFWFGAGCLALAGAAAYCSPTRLARLSRKKYLYPLVAAGLLLLTWAMGPQINGRRLWLALGPVSLQTVELVKCLMVLFVASYFASEHPQLLARRSLWAGGGAPAVLGPLVLMHALPLLALFVQRDFGPAVLLYGFFLLMTLIGTGNRMAPLLGFGLVLAAGAAGWWLKAPSMLVTRVKAWLAPFSHSEQLARALWSLAEGGLEGSGWGLGRPQAVPLAYSDFAYVALGHELGFAGAVAVAALFGVLAGRGLLLAARLADPLSRLIVAGITVIMALQALMVLGGVTCLVPLAGLTLPFVSHGGSSLVVNLAMLGVLLRLSHER